MAPEPGGKSLRWHARAAMSIVTMVLIVAAAGIPELTFNSHYSAYFDATDARLMAHESIAGTFSRHDSVLVVLHSPRSSVLDPQVYLRLQTLTDELGRLPNAYSAFSLTGLDIIGDIEIEDGSTLPSAAQLAAHDRAIGLLASEDLHYASIRVEFRLPAKDAGAVLETMDAVRTLVENETRGTALVAHFTGTLALNEAYIDVVRHDLRTIVPVLLVVMCLALAWLLGSMRAALAALPVGLSAIIASFGLAGLLSAELAAINSFVPVIILSISLAGCVHMSLSYANYRARGLVPAAAALEAARFNLLPMALANGTTALGFLGLLLSPSPPIRVVGYVVACGVGVSFLLCMTLLPLLQARFDTPPRQKVRFEAGIRRIAGAVANNRGGIMLLFALLSLPAVFLSTRNVISDNVFEYFPETHAYYRDTDVVERQFSGINEVLYELDFEKSDALFSPGSIDTIASFASWLRAQPEVLRVASLSDHAAIVEARLDGRLPERLSNLQRMAEPQDRSNVLVAREVSRDYSSALVSVYLRRMDSAELVAFDQRAHEWADDRPGTGTLLAGGPALMFAYLGENNIRGMLYALSAALVVAACMLGIVLRSARIAVAGLICNILPIVLVYSAWAVLNGRISIGAAIVMGMILGIVIDDTIYLLSTYRRHFVAGDENPVLSAMVRIGPALIITTITLVAGLGMGMFSDFGPIWSMSVLSVAIVAVALVTDLSLLPAMLIDRDGNEHA